MSSAAVTSRGLRSRRPLTPVQRYDTRRSTNVSSVASGGHANRIGV